MTEAAEHQQRKRRSLTEKMPIDMAKVESKEGGTAKDGRADALRQIAEGHPDSEMQKPWLDEEGNVIWSAWRVAIAQVIHHPIFQNVLLVVIVFNLFLIVYETDQEASCFPKYKDQWDACPNAMENINWLYVLNLILLILYSIEATLGLLVERAAYFTKRENWLDFGICVVGWISMGLGGIVKVSWLRILRVTRIFRHPRVKEVKELHMLVSGFSGSMRAIAFGAALLIGSLVFSSILLVQYIHPSNLEVNYGDCERCSRGFETVIASSLTLFQQIIAGDSWGQLSIPNIERDWKAALLLPAVHFIIGLGIMNLILAVIVDRAVEAREAKKEDALVSKMNAQRDRKRALVDLFEELDEDKNGVLDFEEVNEAYDKCAAFRMMMVHAGVHKEDLRDIFEYLDENHDAEVSYIEFCDALEDVTQRDARVLSALTHLTVHNLSRKTNKRLDLMFDAMTKLIRGLENKLDVHIFDVVDERSEKPHVFQSEWESEQSEKPHVQLVAKNTQDGNEKQPGDGAEQDRSSAQQSSMTVFPVALAEQSSNMADVLRCLEQLKADIDQQFQHQETDHSRNFKAGLSSALSALRPLDLDTPCHMGEFGHLMPHSPRCCVQTPRHGPPGSHDVLPNCQSLSLAAHIGKDFPATDPDSPRHY